MPSHKFDLFSSFWSFLLQFLNGYTFMMMQKYKDYSEYRYRLTLWSMPRKGGSHFRSCLMIFGHFESHFLNIFYWSKRGGVMDPGLQKAILLPVVPSAKTHIVNTYFSSLFDAPNMLFSGFVTKKNICTLNKKVF